MAFNALLYQLLLLIEVPEEHITPAVADAMLWGSIKCAAVYSASFCMAAIGRRSEDYFAPITPAMDMHSILHETEFMCVAKLFVRFYATKTVQLNDKRLSSMPLSQEDSLAICEHHTVIFDTELFPCVQETVDSLFDETGLMCASPPEQPEFRDKLVSHMKGTLYAGLDLVSEEEDSNQAQHITAIDEELLEMASEAINHNEEYEEECEEEDSNQARHMTWSITSIDEELLEMASEVVNHKEEYEEEEEEDQPGEEYDTSTVDGEEVMESVEYGEESQTEEEYDESMVYEEEVMESVEYAEVDGMEYRDENFDEQSDVEESEDEKPSDGLQGPLGDIFMAHAMQLLG